jgi:hypothetical protein
MSSSSSMKTTPVAYRPVLLGRAVGGASRWQLPGALHSLQIEQRQGLRQLVFWARESRRGILPIPMVPPFRWQLRDRDTPATGRNVEISQQKFSGVSRTAYCPSSLLASWSLPGDICIGWSFGREPSMC